jgi:large subunit ribosomal protein L4
MSALSYKAKDNAIVIVEDVQMQAPKTSQFTTMLKNLGVAGKKSLFVMPENSDNLYLSLRNVANVNGTLIRDINTYDIINANVLVLTENAAKVFTAVEEEA